MKKCPVGGFGTVDARIPLSQSVACGPTMETRALLESRAVDGPALTREETAGGSLGIEQRWMIPTPSYKGHGTERTLISDQNPVTLGLPRSLNSTPNVRDISGLTRGNRCISSRPFPLNLRLLE